MHFRDFYLALAAVIFSINTVFANPENTVKIAVIAEKTSNYDKSPLISMLEVELSQKKDIQLLERAAIDKILEEQKLSAAGLLDRNMTIKIGKLLRADAFIILSLENPVPEQSRVNQMQDANDLIRVRVSETAHGLRLLDSFEQSNSKNPQKAVEGIIQKIESILNKINQPDEKLIPVGIVDIHRVQLGEQYKMLERTLPTMLSVRLSLEPQIIILEREDLKVLLDEKLMTEGEDSEFWSSAILIDGYIQPSSGQLELHLNLKQAAGDNFDSIVVPVEPNNAVVSIDKASTEIIEKLQDSPPTAKWNLELEAEQFYKKAQMLFAHSRYIEAMNLVETAHAIQPNNIFYTERLFINEWTSRNNKSRVILGSDNKINNIIYDKNWSPYYTDYELSELVSVLIRQICNSYQNGNISGYDIYNKFSKPLGMGLSSTNGYFENRASVSSEQVKIINRVTRDIWIDIIDEILQQQVVNSERPIVNDIWRARLAWISSDDSEEIMKNLKKVISENVLPPELGGKIESKNEKDEFLDQVLIIYLQNIYSNTIVKSHLEIEKIRELLRQYINELIDKDYEVVSMKLKEAISNETFRILYHFDESEETKTKEGRLKIISGLVERLTNPDEILNKETKLEIISQIQNAVGPRGVIQSLNERFLIWQKVCNYFIERKDIDGIVAVFTKSVFGQTESEKPEINAWLNQVYEQSYEILEQHKNEDYVAKALENITVRRKKLEILPVKSLKQKPDEIQVNMILEEKDWPTRFNLSYFQYQKTIQNNILWVIYYGNKEIDVKEMVKSHKLDLLKKGIRIIGISLVGIDLNKQLVKSLLQTEVVDNNSSFIDYLPSSLVIFNEVPYLFLPHLGIVEISGTLSKGQSFIENPRLLTTEQGLPSLNITSMVTDSNDNVWIAYGDREQESGLGRYNPIKGEWESLFCSIIQGEPPFSNGLPYQINSIMSVNSDKLFFMVSGLVESEPWKSQLWKIDINTHKTEYVRNLSGEWFNDSDNIWIRAISYLIKFDPVSEKNQVIMRESRDIFNRYPNRGTYVYGLDENLFVPEDFLKKVKVGRLDIDGELDYSNSAIYQNKLWAKYGKNQIIIAEQGKSFEEATIIENNILNGKPVLEFVSSPNGLFGIGEGIVGLIEAGD